MHSFPTLALMTFWTTYFFVLCIIGYLPASLVSTHYMLGVAPHPIYLSRMSPDTAEWPLVAGGRIWPRVRIASQRHRGQNDPGLKVNQHLRVHANILISGTIHICMCIYIHIYVYVCVCVCITSIWKTSSFCVCMCGVFKFQTSMKIC